MIEDPEVRAIARRWVKSSEKWMANELVERGLTGLPAVSDVEDMDIEALNRAREDILYLLDTYVLKDDPQWRGLKAMEGLK